VTVIVELILSGNAARQWLLIAVSHVVLYFVKRNMKAYVNLQQC